MKEAKLARQFASGGKLKRQMRKNHRGNKNLGNCRHCGKYPVARSAQFCPHCGGQMPNPAQLSVLVLLGFIGLLFFIALAPTAEILFGC